MANYTELSDEAALDLAGQWGLEIRRFDPIPGGAANSSYFLETIDGTHLVLTVLNNHDVATATDLVDLVRFLHAADIPTPPILERPDGSDLVVAEGHPVIIKEYAEGTVSPELTLAALSSVGAALMHLHELDAPERFRLRSRRLPSDWKVAAQEFDARFRRWLETVERLIGTTIDGLPRTSLVHGDLFPDNIVVTPETGKVQILDWETAGFDAPEVDLGFTIVGLCRSDANAIDPGRRDSLLDGYGATFDAAATKPCAIHAAAVYGYHRYLRHRVKYPNAELADYYLEMCEFAASLDCRLALD